MSRIRLQVVGHLVLRRKRVGRSRKAHADKAIESRRRKQAKRVPPLAPAVTDSPVRLENDELETAPRQVVADRESGLATADDNGLNTMWRVNVTHGAPLASMCAVTSFRCRCAPGSSGPPVRRTKTARAASRRGCGGRRSSALASDRASVREQSDC